MKLIIQPDAGVVPIVTELIQQQAILGEHAQQPLESVSCFVQHIRNAIGARQSACIERIGERASMIAGRLQ